MIQPSPKFQVHLVDGGAGEVGRRLECRRCARDLPEDNFPPVKAWFMKDVDRRWKRKVALHPFCRLCRKQERGEYVRHPDYSPDLDHWFCKYLPALRGGAASRKIPFYLEKDDLLGLFLKQGGRCALTGIKMEWQRRPNRKGRGQGAPSCDRIDSNGAYVLGNVHLVLQIVNLMKRDLPLDVFTQVCDAVAAHRALGNIEIAA